MADTCIAVLKDLETKWQDPSLSKSDRKRVAEAARVLATKLETPGENVMRLTYQWVCIMTVLLILLEAG
jgi:hypothetical protein